MSECTTDRRPLLADSDKNEQVLAWVHDNEYKDHPRWVFRHYTNVEVGQPWLPTPEPYTIDTSLAASIERDIQRGPRRGMACTQPCMCSVCDGERIYEAAKKWDVIAKKSLKEGWSSCADALVAPHKRKPLDLDAPDPGEGWELCSAREAEQNWNDVAGKWMNGKDYGGFNRRRVVMTTPPSNWFIDQRVWNLQADGWHDRCGAFMSGYARTHPVGWLAWCYRLDGETEPPQFALEWANNR